MSSSEITRELQSLTETWRNNNFVFTGEQKKKYDKLSTQSRVFIKQCKVVGRVFTATTATKLKVKKEEKA